MKNSTEEIDELIKKALSQEEVTFYDELDEQSLFEKALGVYKGKMKWIAIFSAVITFIIFGLTVYCLIHFLQAEDMKGMMLWGMGIISGMLMVSFLKLFHWMQMDKNAILRELKRVELQIGVLTTKLADNK